MKRNFHVVHPCQQPSGTTTFFFIIGRYRVETTHSVGILKCYYWDAIVCLDRWPVKEKKCNRKENIRWADVNKGLWWVFCSFLSSTLSRTEKRIFFFFYTVSSLSEIWDATIIEKKNHGAIWMTHVYWIYALCTILILKMMASIHKLVY